MARWRPNSWTAIVTGGCGLQQIKWGTTWTSSCLRVNVLCLHPHIAGCRLARVHALWLAARCIVCTLHWRPIHAQQSFAVQINTFASRNVWRFALEVPMGENQKSVQYWVNVQEKQANTFYVAGVWRKAGVTAANRSCCCSYADCPQCTQAGCASLLLSMCLCHFLRLVPPRFCTCCCRP